MDFLSVVISLCLLMLSLIFFKKGPLHPAVLFFLVWFFVCTISVAQTTLYHATSYVYMLIILMMISFFIGSLSYLFPEIRIKSQSCALEVEDVDARNELNNISFGPIYVLLVVYILFSFIDTTIILKNYLGGTEIWVMRGWRMATYGVDSNPLVDRQSFPEVVLRAVVLYPFQSLVAPIVAYLSFQDKLRAKYKAFFILAAICLVLTITATGGSRNTIVYYMACFLLFHFLSKHKDQRLDISKNKKGTFRNVGLLLLVGISIGAILFVTNARTSVTLIDSISSYFGLSPTLLMIHLPRIASLNHTYGFSTLFGFFTYPMRFLQQIGLGSIVPHAYNDAFQQVLIAQRYYFVSPSGLTRNAYVTPIYYFMIDGGIPFTIFASFFFGLIVGQFSKKVYSHLSIVNFSVYAVLMQAILFSFVQVPTVQPSFVFSLILIFVLLRPRKRYKENNGYKYIEGSGGE